MVALVSTTSAVLGDVFGLETMPLILQPGGRGRPGDVEL